MNRYAFCNNEPTDNTDVLGLSTWGDVWENWKKLPQETWDSFCTTLDSKIKSHVQDYKTDRINGCKFACCPLPAAAFAAIAEVVLDKFFPKHVEKKCPAGRTCCNKVEDKGPVNYGPFYFTFETGPHIGENGHVTVGTVDITPLLEEYGGYKPTSVKTTCRFSGQITFDGEFKVMIGDCVK
jgi:hypothetical protein